MKHTEYSWKTLDGLAVFARTWEPEGAPKAAVALVHGVGDHSGRFPWLVEAFASAGYAVSAFDQRGHGRTEGPRVHAASYESLLRDLERHVENTRERFPGIPLFVYGHSFGAAEALCYVLQQRPRIAGVVASSPGLASGVRQPPVKILAGRLLSRLVPRLHIPLGSPMSTLSHDSDWLASTRQDPMFFGTLSARIAMEMMRANQWIISRPGFPLPLLIMQGTADRYVDPEVNIAFARRMTGDVTLKVWEGLGHELHNELRRDEVLRCALTWLDAHLEAPAG